MKPYLIKTPRLIKFLFKNFIWDVKTTKKEVFLTFDDGPMPKVTHFVLGELKKHHAKATFFCIGKNIEQHPEVFNAIISEGHSIGNHTYDHFNSKKHTPEAYLKNVDKAEQSIAARFPGKPGKLFRPPYGRISQNKAKKLTEKGYKIVMWDVLSADFDLKNTPEKCINNVLENINPGSIIVFHDSAKSFPILKKALPKILDSITEEGYEYNGL